jgi:cardiolipin synthase (CMP-forming)
MSNTDRPRQRPDQEAAPEPRPPAQEAPAQGSQSPDAPEHHGPAPRPPTEGTPEPHPPIPGPPNREGSPAAEEAARPVHTPTAEGAAPVAHPATTGAAPPDPDPDSTSPDPASGGEPDLAPGPLGPSRRVSSAIRTVPNAVTLIRLLLMPVCAWLLGTGRYGWGLALTAVVGSTDWVDGWLARRFGQVSRVGQLLDPLADRLLIASVAIALVIRGVVPWPAAVLLVARDLVLLAGWPLLKRRGIEPPEVILLGKAATLVLLLALPVLTLGATGVAVAGVAHVLGLLLLWAGVAMYYLAGAVYVRMVLERLGQRARAGS